MILQRGFISFLIPIIIAVVAAVSAGVGSYILIRKPEQEQVSSVVEKKEETVLPSSSLRGASEASDEAITEIAMPSDRDRRARNDNEGKAPLTETFAPVFKPVLVPESPSPQEEIMLRPSDVSPEALAEEEAQKGEGGEEQVSAPIEESVTVKEPIPTYPISPSGWSPPKGCSGDAVTFTHAPVNENRVTFITPIGRMSDSHVTPTDHGYINVGEGVSAPVLSPAAGEIVDIGAFPRPNDFRVTIWHSCTVSTIYIHVTDLAPEIRAHVGDLPPGKNWFGDNKNPLLVAAGQTVGTMRRSVDFSVHDTNVILSGFVTPSLYDGEPWKIHTVDLYDYFAEPLRTELRGKSERTVAPIGGKIDHDIDGRLVGNWFLEGTGSYSGDPGDYWENHLAIAYDHVTPTTIQISDPKSGIDDQAVCNVCFNVYGVKNNAPDPADVSVTTGLVKYELLARKHVQEPRTGANITVNDENKILGVFLAQMLTDRRIQVEAFPGKTAAEVSGFTSAAKIYER